MDTTQEWREYAQRNREKWSDARHGAEAWRKQRWLATHGQPTALARCIFCSWTTVLIAPETLIPSVVLDATWQHLETAHFHHAALLRSVPQGVVGRLISRLTS